MNDGTKITRLLNEAFDFTCPSISTKWSDMDGGIWWMRSLRPRKSRMTGDKSYASVAPRLSPVFRVCPLFPH